MDTKLFSGRPVKILGLLTLLMVIIALGMYSRYTWKQSEFMYNGPVTISVVGEGEVTAVPNVGQFTFSVQAAEADAVTAREKANTAANAILTFLKDNGVDEKDIKTDAYNLYPKYKYEAKPCPYGSYCPQEQVEDGFEVVQSMSVKVQDLDKAGELIAGVNDLGATNISGLVFTQDDPSVLVDEARVLAIKDAKEKAEVLAKELGVRIEKMVGYYEDEGYARPYYNGMGGDMMVKTAMESSVTPDLPLGENVTKSKVTITYQVK